MQEQGTQIFPGKELPFSEINKEMILPGGRKPLIDSDLQAPGKPSNPFEKDTNPVTQLPISPKSWNQDNPDSDLPYKSKLKWEAGSASLAEKEKPESQNKNPIKDALQKRFPSKEWSDSHYEDMERKENEAKRANESIVQHAKGLVGSTKYNYKSTYGTGAKTNKCNQYVYDVLEKSGTAPKKVEGVNPFNEPHDPGAKEWENPKAVLQNEKGRWEVVASNVPQGEVKKIAKPGDVISGGGHMGIVTGNGETTSAANTHDIHEVVTNDWGMRDGESKNMTVRRWVPK